MRYILFILFLSISSVSFGQSTTDNVAIALKTGSSRELIKYFNTVTELKVEDKGANYSKAQAESIIKDFFTKYPPQNFTYIHKGSSPEGLKYNIGRYTSDQGSFRVVMLLKQVQSQYVVDTISFNKE
ncbi:DUF4783 domain-containing protein [Reichenbachiella sp. MALMAid0571]|uniref:DUF4783 domain-containing protein n=1 Tax=Reichenbachiella sp. MALMAid0571 TaxID=3143939 RepID=UPI0032DFD72A